MARIGLFAFLGRGHLNPLAALARKLISQGHSITAFHMAMAKSAVLRAGLDFCCIDLSDPPNAIYSPTSRKDGPHWMGTRDVLATHVERVLREGPAAVKANKIDFMIVDQSDLAAGTVAETLGIPFATIACAPPLIMDADVPLSYFGWNNSRTLGRRIKTFASNLLVNSVAAPLITRINEFRKANRLTELKRLSETMSRKVIITQLPRFFDFPRRSYPPHFFYAGPFRDDREDCAIRFPWDRLTGERIIFASLGTVHNNDARLFRTIARACHGLKGQLVISLGGGTVLPEHLTHLEGKPLVVEYAPQRELFKRVALVINCAGLNTTLDALAAGVPMVALPIAEDQPGVAARLDMVGVGRVIRARHLTEPLLQRTVEEVFEGLCYRQRAKECQAQLQTIDGLSIAADLLQCVMAGGQPRRSDHESGNSRSLI